MGAAHPGSDTLFWGPFGSVPGTLGARQRLFHGAHERRPLTLGQQLDLTSPSSRPFSLPCSPDL